MEMNMTGPLLTDARFFGELLDTAYPGLEEIPALAEKGDFAACRKIFADFFRGFLQPETYFSSRADKGVVNMTDDLVADAENGCRHLLTSCGTPHQFGEKVDWFLNPTSSSEYGPIIPDWWVNIYPLTYYFLGCYLREYKFNLRIRYQRCNLHRSRFKDPHLYSL